MESDKSELKSIYCEYLELINDVSKLLINDVSLINDHNIIRNIKEKTSPGSIITAKQVLSLSTILFDTLEKYQHTWDDSYLQSTLKNLQFTHTLLDKLNSAFDFDINKNL